MNENEGSNGKKGKLSQIWIRPNMALGKSHFFGIEARASGGEKEKERKEKEKKKRRRINPGMETIRGWNCMEFLFGNFLCDVWNFGIGTTINLVV